MDSLPSLPTDSLYKFLAVAGIALTVSSVWTFGKGRDLEFVAKQVMPKNHYEWSQMQEEVEDSVKRTNSLDKKINEIAKELGPVRKFPDEELPRIQKLLNEMWPLIIERDRHLNKTKARFPDSFPLYNEMERSLFDRETAFWYQIAATFMLAFGVLLSVAGFKLWYTRIQMPVDRKLNAD